MFTIDEKGILFLHNLNANIFIGLKLVGGRRIVCGMLTRKFRNKRTLGRPRNGWEDSSSKEF
jgi:hypothetical protein